MVPSTLVASPTENPADRQGSTLAPRRIPVCGRDVVSQAPSVNMVYRIYVGFHQLPSHVQSVLFSHSFVCSKLTVVHNAVIPSSMGRINHLIFHLPYPRGYEPLASAFANQLPVL